MFITIQGINLNSDLIKSIEAKGKNILVKDINDIRSIYYFKTSKEAREVEQKLIKELNNGN